MELSPPKPRLALRIGITGHRPHKLSEAMSTLIETALEQCLALVGKQLQALKFQRGDLFNGEPVRFTLITGMAEGADRVAARAAMRAGMMVEAVLPFPRDVFEQDFSSPESKADFRNLLEKSASVLELDVCDYANKSDSGAVLGYAAAGRLMLRQCDLLVTVWDGQAASGKAGTADIVEQARKAGIPCLWFDSQSGEAKVRKASSKLIDLGPKDSDWEAYSASALSSIVEQLVLPTTVAGPSGFRRALAKQLTGLRRFFSETLPASNGWFIAFPMLVDILTFRFSKVRHPVKSYIRRHGPGVDEAQGWGDGYWRSVEDAMQCPTVQLKTVVERRFLWADQLANYYGQKYRGTYVLLFLLAPLTVAFAVLSLIVPSPKLLSGLFSAFEWVLIMAMVGLGYWGWRRNWHQLWIDYRQLAEMLRHARILALTGTSLPEMHSIPEPDALGAGSQWVQWYYRATMREIGICGSCYDRNYAAAVAKVIRESELKEQIEFHRANASRQHLIEKRLEYAGLGALGLSFLGVSWHIFFAVEGGPNITPLLSIGMPALGAALFAIRAQGDFAGIGNRAKAMADHLEMLDREIAAQQSSGITISLLEVCADAAADTMLSEVSQWRQIFFSKRIAIPA